MPALTICVPAYNAANLISKTLESLRSQTFTDFTVVVVDDASSDATPNIVREFIAKDARISLRQRPWNSGGCGLAVQEEMSNCESPFFCWIAADDEMYPEYLETLVTQLTTHESLGYVYSDFTLIGAQGEVAGTWSFPLPRLHEYVRKVLLTLSGALPMNGVFRMSALRERGLGWLLYQDETASSDTISGLHFRRGGLEIGHIPAPLFRYRLHSTNLSKNTAVRAVSNRRVLDFIFEHFHDICAYEAARLRLPLPELHTRVLAAANLRLGR